MVDLGGLAGLQELKIFYISVIIFIILLIRGWNMYNKMRYGKKKRRIFVQGASEEKLEKCFKLIKKSAAKIQGMKEIDIDFLEGNQLRIQDSKKSGSQVNGYFKSS